MKQLLLMTFWLVSLLGPIKVLAQVSPTPTLIQEPPMEVLLKERFDEEIKALNEIYRGQLAEYRVAEKEFLIAQDQYRELQTLASINKVTEAARQVMKIRGQVLLTYYELLRVRLIAAEGIELSLKDGLLPKLEQQKTWLQTQQQVIVEANDREEFNALSDSFSQQLPTMQAVSQEAISILTVGKLQDVFDRLALIGEDIIVSEASNSAVADSRAMRETNRTTEEVRASFQTAWSELRQSISNNRVSSFYNNLSKTLNPVYSSLNKLAAFLEELLRTL